METLKEDERIKPSFFHRMKTNTNKEEIFSLIDDKNLGKETRVPAEISNVATTFYKELWVNRQVTRAHGRRKMSQMLDKIKRKVDNTTKIEGDKPLTIKEVKEATKALLKINHQGLTVYPPNSIKHSSMSLNGSLKYYKK